MKLAQTLVLILLVAGCHNQAAQHNHSTDSGYAHNASKNKTDLSLNKTKLVFTQHRFSYPSKPFVLTDNRIADTVVAEFDYNYPEAVGNSIEAKWFNQQIKRLLGFNLQLSFADGENKSIEDFLPEQRNCLSQIDTATTSLKRFIDQQQITVEYVRNGYTQLYIETAFYQGGPHIDYEKKYAVLDLKLHKRLRWKDVTNMHENKLGALIERHFRAEHNLAPNADLTEILPVHHLLPIANFSLDEKGIRFLYNFYPSPGENFPEVFIPFRDLKGTLQPALESRMGLIPGHFSSEKTKKAEPFFDQG